MARANTLPSATKLTIWFGVTAIGAGILVFLMPATFIVLGVGMAPTLVAIFFDVGRKIKTVPCMSLLNMAGVLPVLLVLWENGNSLAAAGQVLQDVFLWALMYGSAAFASFVMWAGTIIARTSLETMARREVAQLRRLKSKLIKEWGEDLEPGAATHVNVDKEAS